MATASSISRRWSGCSRRREPALVSVMFANNETGVLQPIADVVRLARQAGALVHCDAVQGAGKVPVDLHGLGVDYLSLSAHKLGGPTGVGALVVRSGAPFAPDRRGGGQESNRRAGTENVAGIAGFGAAAEAAREGLMVEGLRDRLERSLLAIAPGARVFGAGAPRLPNTSCISMPGVKAETQVMALDLAGVAVSAGAACSSGKVQPLGGAGGHGRRRCRGRDGDQNKLRLEHRIRRYRTLDRGLAGPIYPSNTLGYSPSPGGLGISRG